MGKILETLRQTARHATSETAAPPTCCCAPEWEADATAAPEADAEIPFIEVGGSSTPMEASPAVLAAAAGKQSAGAPLSPAPVVPPQPALATDRVTKADRLIAATFKPAPTECSPLLPPAQRFAPELIVFHQPHHAVSEQYQALADALLHLLPVGLPQTVLFTAAAPGVGATTTMLNLALALAGPKERHVVVVDANLCGPAVAERLGLLRTPGLREVLAGTVSLPKALQESGQPNLVALTAGVTVPGKNPRLAEPGWHTLLLQLHKEYDLVLVDGPCWAANPETASLGSACEAVCLVLDRAEADTPAVQELSRSIAQTGSHFLGCFLTQAV